MYLTAQKVVSQDGQIGINAFYHLHRAGKQPKLSNLSEIVSVAENDTGKLIADKCDIKPGGNRVKSFLDIVASDKIDEKSINTALEKFRDKIAEENIGPIVQIIGGVGLRFSAEIKLFKSFENEYVALKERAMSLFRHARSR
jgi:hypothetical protein